MKRSGFSPRVAVQPRRIVNGPRERQRLRRPGGDVVADLALACPVCGLTNGLSAVQAFRVTVDAVFDTARGGGRNVFLADDLDDAEPVGDVSSLSCSCGWSGDIDDLVTV